MKITYFVHGTTIDNEKGISSGWNDVELSELGIQHSKQARDAIEGRTFDAVFCSDLKRAVDSAKIIFENKVEIIFDERLRECNYGEYNGKPSSIVEPMQEQKIYESFENGESYEDVKKRVLDFLNETKTKYDNKHIAIVAHKAPQLVLDVICNKKTWEKAFNEDWRKTKSWQPGWEYEF